MSDDDEEDSQPVTYSHIDLSHENIPGKIQLYLRLLEDLFYKSNLTKKRLDMYHQRLHRINSIIQLSVIYISAAGSFVQALSSKTYEIIFPEVTTDTSNNITEEKCGYLKTIPGSGTLSTEEFDEVIYNLVNFMTYVGEPSRADRERIGWYVILFFIIFTSFAYLLFKEYQKDYH